MISTNQPQPALTHADRKRAGPVAAPLPQGRAGRAWGQVVVSTS